MEGHHATKRQRILRITGDSVIPAVDWILGEEPLTIRVKPLAGQEVEFTTTLRTPGDDFALAVGLLASETGLTHDDLAEVRYCGHCDAPRDYNTVTVTTRRPVVAPARTTLRTSSCGWCGIDHLTAHLSTPSPSERQGRRVPLAALTGAVAELVERQQRLARTGAAHAALITLPDDSRSFGEDVGRHNALDKAIGHAILEGRGLTGALVALSGRAGGDLVAKAARIGATHVVAVSAPSALAVALAEAHGVTLVGFCRGDRCNVYSHPEQIEFTTAEVERAARHVARPSI